MGIASYDVTGDGYPDLFLTSQAESKLQTLAAGPSQPRYRDIGAKRGVNVAQPFTGDEHLPSTAWHPEFEDVNNDGFIDLFITKGNVDRQPGFATKDPSNLLLGQPDGTFKEAADVAGILNLDRGRGAALADFNLDGLLDLVEVNVREPGAPLEKRRLRRRCRASADGRLAGRGARRSPAPTGTPWARRSRSRSATSRSGARSRWEAAMPAASWAGSISGSARREARACAWCGPTARRDPGCRSTRTSSSTSHEVPARHNHGCPRVAERGVHVMKARLETIELPEFGMPEERPELPDRLYPARVERLRARMEAHGYDRLVVYADREHSANLAYLSGFDPRFEEAVLVLGSAGDPAILVGNECFGMAGAAPLPDAAGAVPGPEPAGPAARPLPAARRDPR